LSCGRAVLSGLRPRLKGCALYNLVGLVVHRRKAGRGQLRSSWTFSARGTSKARDLSTEHPTSSWITHKSCN
jgi:hypothetical protein